MKYSLFIGRWQPWHEGHKWLIDQRLKEGKKVCIAVRDVEPTKDQPWTADEIVQNIKEQLYFEITEDKVIIIPFGLEKNFHQNQKINNFLTF